MKLKIVYILTAIIFFAGCSKMDEPVDLNSDNAVTRFINLTATISGPTEIRKGGEYTYTVSTSSSNTVSFSFGIINNGTFEPRPDLVRVTSATGKIFKIVPLAGPGKYVVRAVVSSGGWSTINDYTVTVKSNFNI